MLVNRVGLSEIGCLAAKSNACLHVLGDLKKGVSLASLGSFYQFARKNIY